MGSYQSLFQLKIFSIYFHDRLYIFDYYHNSFFIWLSGFLMLQRSKMQKVSKCQKSFITRMTVISDKSFMQSSLLLIVIFFLAI